MPWTKICADGTNSREVVDKTWPNSAAIKNQVGANRENGAIWHVNKLIFFLNVFYSISDGFLFLLLFLFSLFLLMKMCSPYSSSPLFHIFFHRQSRCRHRRHFHLASSLLVIHSVAVRCSHSFQSYTARSDFVLLVSNTLARMLWLPSMTITKLCTVELYEPISCVSCDRLPFVQRTKGFNAINEQFSFNVEYYTYTQRKDDNRREERIQANLFRFMLQITTDSVYGFCHFFFFILFFPILSFLLLLLLPYDPMPWHRRSTRHLAKYVMQHPKKI